MNETEVLFDVAILGEQVDAFYHSDMGKFILTRLEAETNAGLKELKTVNPSDAERVREAQNRVWRAESLKGWLDEAIMAGLKAKDILEDREDLS